MAALLMLLIILIILDFLKNKKIFTPGILFNGIFFITLFLYSFYLSNLQQELLPRTILIFSLCVLGYNIPVFLSYFIKPVIHLAEQKEYCFSKTRRYTMCAICVILFLVQVVYSGGCPLLWKIMGDGRTYFDFGIPSFTGVFYGFLIVLGAWSLLRRGFDKFVYLAIGLLMVSRQVLISIAVEGVIFKLLTMKKVSGKFYFGLIIGIILGILAFSLIGNFRTGEDSFLTVAEFKPEYDWIPTAFKWIYSYLCFSISNLNNLVSITAGAINWGASSVSELVPTILVDVLNITPQYSPYFLVKNEFNTSTFLPPLYLDFGIIGCFIFCLLIGCIVQRVYRNVKYRKNCVNCMIYAVFAHNILLLFFNNMFLYLPILSQFVFIPIVFKRIRQQKSEKSKLCFKGMASENYV